MKFTLVGSSCYTTAVILDLHFQNYIILTGHHLARNIPQCPILVIKPCIGKDENLRDRHKFYTHIKKGCHGNFA